MVRSHFLTVSFLTDSGQTGVDLECDHPAGVLVLVVAQGLRRPPRQHEGPPLSLPDHGSEYFFKKNIMIHQYHYIILLKNIHLSLKVNTEDSETDLGTVSS